MQKEYNFYVYIISSYNRQSLYVGFCNNIVRRTIEHTKGLGCDYSKKYKTVELLYYEHYQYVDDALGREKQIKRWNKNKKIALIKTKNPELISLNQELFKDYQISSGDVLEIAGLLKENYSEK